MFTERLDSFFYNRPISYRSYYQRQQKPEIIKESDDDALFVKNMGSSMGLPVYDRYFNTEEVAKEFNDVHKNVDRVDKNVGTRKVPSVEEVRKRKLEKNKEILLKDSHP